MSIPVSRLFLVAAAFTLAPSLAHAQFQGISVGTKPGAQPNLRTESVLVVDASGQGQFTDLQAAVSAAPPGAMLLVKPGAYAGVTIEAKSLRIEASVPGEARLVQPLVVRSISPVQEVYVGGLHFEEGFEISSCDGEVNLSGCSAVNDGVTVPAPAGMSFFNYPDCGSGLSRHLIANSAGVSLVDCLLEGRDGSPSGGCDGVPGEHGLLILDSRVTVYGGHFVGGDGSDGPGCHGGHAGSGGDGVLARGVTTRIVMCGASGMGGEGGLDLELNFFHGCHGELSRALDRAGLETCAVDNVTLDVAPLVHAGDLPSYTIAGPPGTEIFLMAAPSRGWREFTAAEGVLHMGAGFTTVSLGVMPPSGTLSRPFPAQTPAWISAFSSIELQVYARVAGQDRYSEPRTLQVLGAGL